MAAADIQFNPYSVSVAGVVVDDQRRALLIRRRHPIRWELPGGVLERGETITEGLHREVREETGLEIEPGPLTGIYQNMHAHVVALAFRCRATGGQLTPNDEAAAFHWATPDEIAAMTTEVFAVRLLDGLRHKGEPAIRFHDGINLLAPS